MAGANSSASRVIRRGTSLYLNDTLFYAVGANVYWIGLDENPVIAYPSKERVLEVLATATRMGSNFVRSTTLGISVGNSLSISPNPSLSATNAAAFEAIDFALHAAALYGLKVIIPLVDQYDYYHGGIPTFLRTRQLDPSDHAPFYSLDSVVYSDFTRYVTTLLDHVSPYTNLSLANDPTIMAFETGNELNAPPPAWTAAIGTLIKSRSASPAVLVMSGAYGFTPADLSLDVVDIVSNHFYPPYNSVLNQNAARASAAGKALFVGEYDWTNRYYFPLSYLLVLLPALLAASVFLLPQKWWPWRIPIVLCCVERRPRKSDSNTQLRDARDTIAIRRYHFSLFILLFAPIFAVIIHAYLPTPLPAFLSNMETLASKSKLAGSAYWSLFGHDSNCSAFVSHNDGYTLHYRDPQDDSTVAGLVLQLIKHAYSLSRANSSWTNGIPVRDITTSQLPNVSCPQPL